jgi:hypothetical protein
MKVGVALQRTLASAILVAGLATVSHAQDPASPVGDWEGAISVQGAQIPMQVHVTEGGTLSATIDIQGASGVPLQNVTFEEGRIRFELPGGAGIAVFDGTLGGDAIKGTFSQAGIDGTFALQRTPSRSGD